VESDAASKGVVVTGVIGEDVHIVGIRVLEHAIRNAGFKVVSLGIHNVDKDFIDAAIESKADVIMVSSLAGHARLLVSEMRDKCDEAGLKDMLLYLGGHLTIDDTRWEDTERIFKDMGFSRVFPPFALPDSILATLDADLAPRSTNRGN